MIQHLHSISTSATQQPTFSRHSSASPVKRGDYNDNDDNDDDRDDYDDIFKRKRFVQQIYLEKKEI